MKFKGILFLVVFSMLAGCAAQEEQVSVREPRKLITKDNYEDLQIKPRKEEPVEVDYKKEGTTRQNFDPLKK